MPEWSNRRGHFPDAGETFHSGRQKAEVVILNGAECEPFLTCDEAPRVAILTA